MVKADKKFIGTFYSQRELLKQIDTLKKQGHAESDMYIVSNDKEEIRMIRGRTDAEAETSKDENWLEKMKHFLMGEDPITGVFEQFGYSKEQADEYHKEARNGGMLLFIDRELGKQTDKAQPPSTIRRELDAVPYETRAGGEPATALRSEDETLNAGGTSPRIADSRKTTLEKAAAGEPVNKERVHAGDRTAESFIRENGENGQNLDHRLAKDEQQKDMTTEESPLKKAASGERVDKMDVHAGDRASSELVNRGQHDEAQLDHRLTSERKNKTAYSGDAPTTSDTPLKRAASGEWVDKEDVRAGDRMAHEAIDRNKQNGEQLDHRLKDDKPHE